MRLLRKDKTDFDDALGGDLAGPPTHKGGRALPKLRTKFSLAKLQLFELRYQVMWKTISN